MGNVVFNHGKKWTRVICWNDVIDIDVGEGRFLTKSSIRLSKEDAIKVARYILEEYDGK